MNSIPTGRKNRGFTLIELLVVIAIIAILAAILFPVFARARENARRASCQSNEKNIALGFKQYIQDNGEKYPPAMDGGAGLKASGSSGALSEYIKSGAIFYCPSDSDKTIGSYGYLLNGQNESAIPESATTPLLNETSATRHFEGQNIAFVDGHVKWGKGGIYANATSASGAVTLTALPSNFTLDGTGYAYGGEAGNTWGSNGGSGTLASPYRVQINPTPGTYRGSLFLYGQRPPAGVTYTFTLGGGPPRAFAVGNFTEDEERGTTGYHGQGKFVLSNFGPGTTAADCAPEALELKMTSSGISPPETYSKTYYFKRHNYGSNTCP